MNVSFVPHVNSKTQKLELAEQMTFESLTSFLYMDLFKGIAVGNLPRKCQHCRRWFLAEGAYNTVYCQRAVPGMKGKTCREVGAHEKEKEKRKEVAGKEYYRAYNRLKGRKRYGTISTDEWNRRVACAQGLKDEFKAGKITEREYVRKLDEL